MKVFSMTNPLDIYSNVQTGIEIYNLIDTWGEPTQEEQVDAALAQIIDLSNAILSGVDQFIINSIQSEMDSILVDFDEAKDNYQLFLADPSGGGADTGPGKLAVDHISLAVAKITAFTATDWGIPSETALASMVQLMLGTVAMSIQIATRISDGDLATGLAVTLQDGINALTPFIEPVRVKTLANIEFEFASIRIDNDIDGTGVTKILAVSAYANGVTVATTHEIDLGVQFPDVSELLPDGMVYTSNTYAGRLEVENYTFDTAAMVIWFNANGLAS